MRRIVAHQCRCPRATAVVFAGACTPDPPAGCPDSDHDGWCDDADCGPTRPEANPGAAEIPYDGTDEACDGGDDYDVDGDGWEWVGYNPYLVSPFGVGSAVGGDCDDSDPSIYPGAPARCGNGKDDDCNEWPDCSLTGRHPIQDLATATLVGGLPEGAADLDGNGRPEWAVLTDTGLSFVPGAVTEDLSVTQSLADLDRGYGNAFGNAGGVSGDDVALAMWSDWDPYTRVWLDPELDPTPDLEMPIYPPPDALAIADWTDDGVGDLLLEGMSLGQNEYRIYAGPLEGPRTKNDQVATLEGAESLAMHGPLSRPGDLTGDGVVDIITGIYAESGPVAVAELPIVPGPISGSMPVAGVTGIGTPDDRLEYEISYGDVDDAYDFDQDGYLDLFLANGWWGAIGGGYLIFHGPFGPEGRGASTADAVIHQDDWPVAEIVYMRPMGDLNADGWPDLALTVVGESSAISFLYGPFDSSLLLSAGASFSVTDTAPEDAGHDLWLTVPAGDVNGDGAAELLVQVGPFEDTSQETSLVLPGVPNTGF